jgi:hypothetical protein
MGRRRRRMQEDFGMGDVPQKRRVAPSRPSPNSGPKPKPEPVLPIVGEETPRPDTKDDTQPERPPRRRKRRDAEK